MEPNWKDIALYLADCHAATAEYDGLLKSTSKHRRDRLVSICAKAKNLIDGTDAPYLAVDQKRVVNRLAGVVLREQAS